MLGYLCTDITCSKNYELCRTDNVCRQISEYIFLPNGDYCVYYSLKNFAGVNVDLILT